MSKSLGFCGRPRPVCAWKTCVSSTGFRMRLLQVSASVWWNGCFRCVRLRQLEVNTQLSKMVSKQMRGISTLRMSFKKCLKPLMQAGRAICPSDIHDFPVAALCDTWCQPEHQSASSFTRWGYRSASSPPRTDVGRSALRRSAAVPVLMRRERLVLNHKRSERLTVRSVCPRVCVPQWSVPVSWGTALWLWLHSLSFSSGKSCELPDGNWQ